MMKYLFNLFSKILGIIILFTNYSLIASNHIKGLDDSILFRINWPGKDDNLLESPDYETLEMTTVNNERFQCLVPLNYGESLGNDDKYDGPNAMELLMPLFKKKICTLRLEAFWTYELCHGQWIKQYHEGREENGQRYQDYNLGTTNIETLEEQVKAFSKFVKENPDHDIPQTKLEGVPMPYFTVSYSGGTICDLTGNPRVTRVLYVCYEEGKHAVYSIKETYTCEYEIIVLSSLLCQHPSYRPQEVPQTNLHCIPLQEGTKRPKNLLHIEAESLKLRTHGTLLGGDISRGSVRIEVIDEDEEPEILSDFEGRETRQSPFPPQPSIDRKLVEDFLNGDYCLQGGSGWWRYEFCHGKIVQQYHEDRDGSKYAINLGMFDFENHWAWLKAHPSKRFKRGNNQVSHFYSGGDYCDAVAKPRQVEVRLKCKESVGSQSSVALYLLEPKTCEYILGVETPLICSLLQNADELGLFSLVDPRAKELENLPREIGSATIEVSTDSIISSNLKKEEELLSKTEVPDVDDELSLEHKTTKAASPTTTKAEVVSNLKDDSLSSDSKDAKDRSKATGTKEGQPIPPPRSEEKHINE